jgi:phenylacetate-CoA ligase
MIVVRGVNIYPSAVEEIINAANGVAEYQVRVNTSQALAELSVQIEPAADCADATGLIAKLEKQFHTQFALRIPVTKVPPGTLPRFEMKAKRWTRG